MTRPNPRTRRPPTSRRPGRRVEPIAIGLAATIVYLVCGGNVASAQSSPAPDPFSPLPPGTVVPGGVTGFPTFPDAAAAPPPPQPARNVATIPPIDAETIWQQLVDVTDDYFKIEAEQRVVFANGVPTEGRIDTFPQTGATLLEPWRGDSVGFRERLESTLQSIRRIGSVRLQPDPAGWRIEVTVLKELENLPRPMLATTGGASFRNDDSLYRYGSPLPTLGQQIGEQPRPVANPTRNAGWIPIGRDPLLEQRILSAVLGRLGIAPLPQTEPYYQAPEQVSGQPGTVLPPSQALPAPSQSGPIVGQPIPAEQLPPGAVIAPGPPVPIETLPTPRP